MIVPEKEIFNGIISKITALIPTFDNQKTPTDQEVFEFDEILCAVPRGVVLRRTKGTELAPSKRDSFLIDPFTKINCRNAPVEFQRTHRLPRRPCGSGNFECDP